MEEKTRNNRIILFVGIGCLAIICICVTFVGTFLVFRSTTSQQTITDNLQNLIPEEIMPEIGTPDVSSLDVPTLPPVEIPTLPAILSDTPTPETNESELDTAGNQFSDDTMLVDDFSTDALDWPVYDDGLTIINYEDQAYSFQITEPNYYDWAYVPATFNPSYIMFDVWSLPGEQDGTFGVFCQYQDPENYYYVEFDLETKGAILAMIREDEFIPLTEPDSNDEYWIPVDALTSSPDEINTIEIDCQLDIITLIVNDQLVEIVLVDSPFTSPGVMAFFVFTFEFAGPDGYKVYFDNVTVR